MNDKISELNREPDIQIEKLSIWVDARQFENAVDRDDGNWLIVRCVYKNENSEARASGAFLMTTDIERFMNECKDMNTHLSGEASLNSCEDNLDIKMKMEKMGRIESEISITNDHMQEDHRYTIPMDQSYLNSIISQCKEVILRFPVRGNK